MLIHSTKCLCNSISSVSRRARPVPPGCPPRTGRRRLFTAGVERLRATYNFTPRTALRLVVQNVRTLRDPALYVAPTIAVEASLTLSALFTYRWSWASAAYLGLGDDREVGSAETFAPGHQQLFVKVQVATP